ncbi:MAG: type II toxin-antitoxin system HigB family toxin [Proteobacteria bacterium]|nr:type II toxin-antitoxin system HigB family toxin [Pseudomonadota bacterium]MBU1697609.1 type II toxin-antitoxin system HigB family toxin [Pseudomonadota bacterium]
MHVIARPQLIKFYQREVCKDAKGPIDVWWYEAKKANWQSWTEIKAQYGSASILKGNRVVFNLGGDKYRLVVKINFPTQTVFIRFVGTHKEYDKINAEEI